MAERTKADAWVREEVARLAKRHFPGRARPLEQLLRTMAQTHEAAWRSTARGVYRPTAAMYALALSWELDKLGPTCVFCKGKVEVPGRPSPSGPSRPTLHLGPRTDSRWGILNVPQNLALGHGGCFPGQ
jgi:hypothetical protein